MGQKIGRNSDKSVMICGNSRVGKSTLAYIIECLVNSETGAIPEINILPSVVVI